MSRVTYLFTTGLFYPCWKIPRLFRFQREFYLFKHGIGKTNILRHGLTCPGLCWHTHTCITFDVTPLLYAGVNRWIWSESRRWVFNKSCAINCEGCRFYEHLMYRSPPMIATTYGRQDASPPDQKCFLIKKDIFLKFLVHKSHILLKGC